jgi:hypothetical protein
MMIDMVEQVETIKSRVRDMHLEITEPITVALLAAVVEVVTPEMTDETVEWVTQLLWDRADYVKAAGQDDYARELYSIGSTISWAFDDGIDCCD